ncbi:phytoene desaturase family protein [Planococcus lenghuensis]|uniref:Oxidoreductase n=1 Tax=Planococcus lenghuensis TaxID=2213202 RepID=A0A1Q2KVX8_9BACL|nr:FAD-dependent oxidoreductase [Planococcus lenghuensis]AQQ52375.1 oxidoreductase [Planococcus lenghuensis]
MKRNVLIVGAGIGGLTAGSLLAKHGMEVTLLEASSELGGCAGKFKRRDFLFPAGATLGMGLEPGGIHERVFRYLQKPFPLEPLEAVMEMVHPETTFTFFRDRRRHVDEIVGRFPAFEQSIRTFYREIYQTASVVRTLMDPLPPLPPANWIEWRYLINSIRPAHMQLLPFMRQTLGQRLKAHELENLTPFRHMLDALLIDSMQTGSEDVSYLLAAVALDIYHEGAYYVPGGLYRFAELMGDSIKENGGLLKKRRTVERLERSGQQWIATDQRGNTYRATDVILNVPIHQLPALMTPELIRKLNKRLRIGMGTPTWTTLTLYVAVETAKLAAPLPPFRQLSIGQGLAEGAHFFVSASQPDDALRAPAGFQTATISTHSEVKQWNTKGKYDAHRELLTDRMLAALEDIVPGFRQAIVHLETGAPRGWTRYTGRPHGFVGGFPQTVANSLFNSISHHAGIPGLYVCGDHIFPGGGTIGAATSGIHAARSISGSLLIEK